MDPLPVFKGLFGPLVIRKPGEARPESEFFLAFHTFDPSITGLQGTFYCVNGKAYAGNTPTLEARVGQRVALPRLRHRQLLPHLPPARPPLDGTGRADRRQQDLRPGRLVLVRAGRGQPGTLVLPLPRLPAPAPGDERLVPRLIGVATAIALLFPAAAGAANTRVSIANYAWSQPQVHVDLGEKVTWDWLGPDLAHSVTGISANDLQWDSDPGTDAPAHRAGDSYTLQFSQPGEYFFQCKLHAAVRGEVIVSDVPGNPGSDPGPQPPLNLDLKPPTLGSFAMPKQRTRGSAGSASASRSASAASSTPSTTGSTRRASASTTASRPGRSSSASTTCGWERRGSTSGRGPGATWRCCGRPTKRRTNRSRCASASRSAA